MPTIIDELVVRFNLDTKGVDEGQRRVLDRIRALQEGAKRGGQAVEREGANIVTFFRGLENPLGAFRAHMEKLATATVTPRRGLNDLASQARRTGASVESGALAGATGLRALGAAGLGAVAVITTLNKLMGDTLQTQRNVFQTGVGAAGAGLPIRQYSAISQALFTNQNVPEADTQSWLTAFTQAKERAAQGDYGQAVALNRQMAIAGISADVFTSTPEQAMVAIARRFGQLTPEQAQASGTLIGMSPTLAQGLRGAGQAPGGLEPMIEAARQRAITSEDRRLALERLKAENDLATSMNLLQRKIADDLTPGIISLDKTLKAIIDFFTTHANLRSAAGAGAAQALGPLGTFFGSIWSLFSGAGKPVGVAPGSWWSRHMPRWLGGGGSTGPSSSAAPRGASGEFGAALAASGLPPEAQAYLASVQAGETAGFAHPFDTLAYGGSFDSSRGFPFGWNNQGRASHGAGAFQDEPATERAIMAGSGITGFGPQDQIRGNWWWAQHVYAQHSGGRDFLTDLRNHTLDPGGMAALSKQWARGGRSPYAYMPRAGSSANDYLAWARRGSATTNNAGDTNHTVHVNTINVHTAATSAQGIGAAALMAAKGADLVTQSNTGYQ